MHISSQYTGERPQVYQVDLGDIVFPCGALLFESPTMAFLWALTFLHECTDLLYVSMSEETIKVEHPKTGKRHNILVRAVRVHTDQDVITHPLMKR